MIPFWIMFFLLPALFALLQLGSDGWQWQVLLPVCSFFTSWLHIISACCAARRNARYTYSSSTHVASPPYVLQEKMVSFKGKGSYFQHMPLGLGWSFQERFFLEWQIKYSHSSLLQGATVSLCLNWGKSKRLPSKKNLLIFFLIKVICLQYSAHIADLFFQ